MISVIVADDHAVVRTGLQLIFSYNQDIEVKAEVDNGNELLQQLSYDSFDVAIVDVNMPGLSSLDLLNEIKEHYPKLPVVIFTMNADEQMASRMFKNGALAYINKEEDTSELIAAVKHVYQTKKRYITKRQEFLFASMFVNSGDEVNHESLTDREYQIMCLLAEGISKTDIADKLSISKNTLSNHRNNILKKLNIANNVELTKYALHHNIIQ